MAKNIYHEARNQGTVGKVAVGLVVLNRVKDNRFPNTVCDVVLQGSIKIKTADPSPSLNVCQFSWYCDGLSDKVYEVSSYKRSIKIAQMLLNETPVDITKGATHYHADYVNPNWSKYSDIVRSTKIGNHIFYKWN